MSEASSPSRPVALASLVLSLAWIGGVGSVAGIALGFFELRKFHAGESLRRGTGLAIAGVLAGIVGLVPAGVMWSDVWAHSASNAILADPSYIDGRTYAAESFSNAARESSVCSASNVQSQSDNLALWMRGCHDAWLIAVSSPSGLNVQSGF
ncbi:MAG: DUF4190 domain-containing protein [Actinomycetota bacterium]|nr:DUF4190 domain-containing protein [Actinomycetota bacterium]